VPRAANIENLLWITSREYLRFLRSRNTSPFTLEAYRQSLSRLARAFPHLEAITRNNMEDWLDGLWADLEPASVAHHHKNLRAFFNWCVERERLAASPMAGIPEPRVRPPVVVPFTPDQVQALYAAAASVRDRLIVALLLNTGIRVSELCNLRPEDVQSGRLRIRGKGAKQRWVGCNDWTGDQLAAYAATWSGNATVFGVSGRTTVYWILRRLGARAGVAKTHPHRFRDTFAVRFLENGGGVDDLQVILGHARIQTTLRYVQWGRAERAIQGQIKYAPSVH